MSAAIKLQPMDYYELKGLDGELNHWGKWIERTSDYTGYPGADILTAALMGSGGQNPGHRVLCLDMPITVYAVHARILRLPEAEQEAVWLRYAIKMKPDGNLWTEEELCKKIKIEHKSFRQRLWRAKRRLLGLPI